MGWNMPKNSIPNKFPTDVDTVGPGQTLHPDHTTSRSSSELLLPSAVVCSLFIQQTTAFVPEN